MDNERPFLDRIHGCFNAEKDIDATVVPFRMQVLVGDVKRRVGEPIEDVP